MRHLKKHAFFFRAAEKLCAALAAALLVFLLIPAAAFADDPDGELLREVIRAGITDVSAYAKATGNKGAQPTGNGILICIDPGHQDHPMNDTEPVGPGASAGKQKLTSGTAGIVSGKTEYEINLEISLLLKNELIRRGYSVLMTRETNDVNISNMERAVMAGEAKADAFIRIHCNSSTDSSVRGVVCYQPGSANPYLPADVTKESRRLAKCLLDGQAASTGQNVRGLVDSDDMTGINWASMPVAIVEMGYMSNPDEDLFLADSKGQALIVKGLADGVDAFFMPRG